MSYDSWKDNLDHVNNVRQKLYSIVDDILDRALSHDATKFESPEKEFYDEHTEKLRWLEYGSKEYKDVLAQMRPAINHHYQHNSHHPEHGWFQEDWKDIKDYKGLYRVSTYGQVLSLDREVAREYQGNLHVNGRIRKPHLTPKGYLRIQLSKDGESKNYMVHRLVADAFIPNPDNKPEVNHKDGNKQNNNIVNLEWATSSENQIHAYENGLKSPAVKYFVRCIDLEITSEGTEKMEKMLRERGYERASSSAIWRCINTENAKHLDLTFEGYPIEEARRFSYVEGMNLLDLLEMVADWKAAKERHKDKPTSMKKSLDINAKRFDISPQLHKILWNTFLYLGWTDESNP